MELTINEQTYRTGTLDAKQQFHIARRIMPVIAKLGEAAGDGTVAITTVMGEDGQSVLTQEANIKMFSALSEALSGLSDVDCDYVIDHCLAVCSRQQGERFVPIWNKQARSLQFADIDMPTMMQLVVAMVMDQLGGFFPAPSGDGTPK